MRYVWSGFVLLKTNVDFTSFNYKHLIVGYHGTITIDVYLLYGIIFEKIWIDDFTGPHTTSNRYISEWSESSRNFPDCSLCQMLNICLALSLKWVALLNKICMENIEFFEIFFKGPKSEALLAQGVFCTFSIQNLDVKCSKSFHTSVTVAPNYLFTFCDTYILFTMCWT